MKMCYNIGKKMNNIALHLYMVNTVIINNNALLSMLQPTEIEHWKVSQVVAT